MEGNNPYIGNNNNKINEALFNAIYEIEAVKKNMKGYNYKYADLSSVLEAIKEPLKNNGLYISQIPIVEDIQIIDSTDKKGNTIKRVIGMLKLTTEIHHKNGEVIKYPSSCMVEDATDPQKVGSCITYMSRYSLIRILFMEQEDDDGYSAKKREEPKKQNDSTYNEQKDVYENPIDYNIAPIGSIKGKKWIEGDIETLCQAKIHYSSKNDKDSIKYYEAINKAIEIKKAEKQAPTVSVTEDEDPFNVGDDRDWEEMVNDSEAEKKTPPIQVKDEFDEEDDFMFN